MNSTGSRSAGLAGPMKQFLDGRMERYMDLLGEMVAINSYTANAAGVDRLGDLTAGIFTGLGFSTERVKSVHREYGHHLHLARGGGRSIGLVSHLDTVFPPEEEVRNDFRFRILGDRVYGPGTVDVKGGTLIILMAMEVLSHLAAPAFEGIAWHLLLDASEETESSDFGDLCVERLGRSPLACLIFEGGDSGDGEYRLVTSRKGRASFLVESLGRGAHAGVDHRSGANAVVQLAAAIRELHDITDYERDVTVNIGSVSGGGPLNRVPHHASLEAEIRAFDPVLLEEGIARILALQGMPGLASADGRFTASTRVTLTQRCPAWPENPATGKLFDCCRRAAAAMGSSVLKEFRGGLSDGNYLWNRVPVLDGLGAAGGNAHCSEGSPDGSKEQEYALISSFVPKAVLAALAMLEMIGDDEPR
ncbi:MAG: M20/M25/M40 family metallo-hydrolase [Spirochaetes bacterium]|nr:M20/M25/M40 family metallo-hydrolase [Spirochaetota bacterium]